MLAWPVLAALAAEAVMGGCSGPAKSPERDRPTTSGTAGNARVVFPAPSAMSATAASGTAVETQAAFTVPLPEGRAATDEGLIEEGELVRGRSTVQVNAPIDKARAKVLEFNHYVEFMPFYRGSRVLDQTPERTKVFMQVAALGGLVKMDAQVWFLRRGAQVDGWETYASEFDSGNVNSFKATWRLRELDPSHTWLSLEVFLAPKLPLPTSVLNDENRKGARDGVTAMRARIETP